CDRPSHNGQRRSGGGGVKVMRGFAVLIGYLLGVSAVFSIGIIGLMALQSLTKPMPSAPVVAASQKERLAKAGQGTTVGEKEAQPVQKHKVAHVTRKRKEEAPTFTSGFSGYGYAQEPRRFYQYPPMFFGR